MVVCHNFILCGTLVNIGDCFYGCIACKIKRVASAVLVPLVLYIMEAISYVNHKIGRYTTGRKKKMATIKINYTTIGRYLKTKLSEKIGGAFVIKTKQLIGPFGGVGWKKFFLSDGRTVFIGEKMNNKRGLPKWILNTIDKNDSVETAGSGDEWRAYITRNKCGCTCKSCGAKYTIDFNIPDDLWKKINHGNKLLCGMCIIQKLTALHKYGSYKIIAIF